MADSTFSSSNPVSRDTVLLAFQLAEFLGTGHQFSSLFTDEIRQSISTIEKTNFRPPQISRGIRSARDERARTRSKSVETQSWPSLWALDRSAIRAALKTFEQGTHSLRRLWDPPSTGETPSPEGSEEPSVHLVEEPSERHSTEETSELTTTEPTQQPSSSSKSSPQETGSVSEITENSIHRQSSPLVEKMAGVPPPPNGIDQAVWNAMIQAMRATLANTANPGPPGPSGPPGPQGPPGQNAQGGSSGSFRACDLGFFHPNLEDSYGAGDIVFSSKETIYREVYSFCRRVEDYAVIKGEDVVRPNLSTCFRGSALSWWLNTLSQDEKDAMMQLPNGLKRTLTRLQERFKISMSSALDQLTRQVYTLKDAGDRRDPASYMQGISKYAVQAGITDEHAQATWAWNHLDVELQASIPPPTTQTTLRQFTEELDNRKELWHRLHQQNESKNHREVRDREREKGRDRDRERDQDRAERSGKERINPRDRQGGYQQPPQRPFFPPRPFNVMGPRAYQPAPQYPNYGYQQPSFPAYPAYPQQSYPSFQNVQQAYPAFPQAQSQNPTAQSSNQPNPQPQAAPRNGLPGSKPPLMITAGNAQPNQYPNRQNYGNRGRFPFYPSRAGNPGNFGMPMPQAPQEAYFHDYPEENPHYAEGYHGNLENAYPQDLTAYHGGTDDHFHDAYENRVPEEEDEKPDPKGDEVDVGFVSVSYHATVGKMGEKPTCRGCQKDFPSNNLLHTHLKTKACKKRAFPRKVETRAKVNRSPEVAEEAPPEVVEHPIPQEQLELIESSAHALPMNGMAFRSWHYLTGLFSLARDAPPESGCLDTGCPMSMGDRMFLKRLIPGFAPKKHDAAITLRGIGPNRHSTIEWTTVSFFMKGETPQGKTVMIKFTRDIHVVDNLKANLLIGMDILGPEGVIVDLPKSKVIFTKCGEVAVPVQATARDNVRIRRVVRAERRQIIPPKATGTVEVSLRGKEPLPDRDFLFEPSINGVYTHLVDTNFNFVTVRNDRTSPLVIPRHHRVGSVVEYEAEEGYPVDVENHSLAAKADPIKDPMVADFTNLLNPKSVIGKVEVDPSLETKLPNGITIYGKSEYVEAMRRISEENPRIWEDSGDTIDLPESEWLQVPISTDWQASSAKLGNKVYPLTAEARKLVDEKFDKMHAQGKMSWSKEPSPFAFPVFVVYKTVYVGPEKIPQRKGRVVVDIRGLNKITIPDNYPLPLQDDIVTSVQGCVFISVVDCSGQFHLFLVRRDHRQRFNVVSHRGSEHFNVAVMGFKNSVPYVQRKMDDFLRPYRHFARCYIDDIVIFSKTAAEHFEHLRIIFRLFARLKITLEPKKSYLGYPSVTLLGQKVDGFGLTTTEERVAAIKELRFPETLEALETYVGMANWLRKNVRYFAQISEPLQRLKTELLKRSPAQGGRLRRNYSKGTIIVPTEEELESFRVLQKSLTTETYLHHFNPDRQLYIDLDGSKRYGFGAMIYHVKGDPQESSFPRTDIEPIMFLSKLLNPAELRYWPTELEVAALIWTLKKIPHMLGQRSGRKVIIFTDHSATTDIARQTTLSSSSTDRMNLRLVRASQYASQFNLDVRWRPGKQNVVPDALSRLLREREEKFDTNVAGVLDDVFSFVMTLTEMSGEYRTKLKDAYAEDKKWARILEVLQAERQNLLKEGKTEECVKLPAIQFLLRDDLIYYQDDLNDRERLCIPKKMEQKVFELAHDNHSHGGFQRTYERIVEAFYMRHLTRRLKRYILHCPQCQLNQTKRHLTYGSLNPVLTPALIFHTVTIDFILALPLLKTGFNTMMTVTDKFSKKVTMVPGKDTWGSAEWASALLLALADWGIPRAIISDRDPKFLSELWKAIFKTLGTDLMVSTAYHPQTDGQSERTNQTVEIALRYHITCHPDEPWDVFAVHLRSTLNNSTNASTGKSPNEIVYGKKLNEGFGINDSDAKGQTELTDARTRNRQEAADSIAFAAADAKVRYDVRHKPITLEPGDLAFVKLHKGYHLPGLENSKLSNQRAGPFKVLRKYGNLAYKLDLPEIWKVHPVISVAMLEPAPKDSDPYQRPRDQGQDPVVDNEDPDQREYEIEALLDKREVRKRGRGKGTATEYLVKWKYFGPAHNVWYRAEDLQDAKELMDKYDKEYNGLSRKEFQRQRT